MVHRLGIWALLLMMPQTSSEGATCLKIIKRKYCLAGENPHQTPVGAPSSWRGDGVNLSGHPPGNRALGAQLQAGRNHLA